MEGKFIPFTGLIAPEIPTPAEALKAFTLSFIKPVKAVGKYFPAGISISTLCCTGTKTTCFASLDCCKKPSPISNLLVEPIISGDPTLGGTPVVDGDHNVLALPRLLVELLTITNSSTGIKLGVGPICTLRNITKLDSYV